MSALYNPSITESAVMTALRAFLLQIFPGVEVVQGLDNQVSMPANPFILITPLTQRRLATNQRTFTEGATPADDVEGIQQNTEISVQIDCYSPQASGWATTITALFRDDFAVSNFPENITPLYADDPRQMALVNAEMQYELRWMTVAHLQFNPVINVPTQLANQLSGPTITKA